MLRSALVTVALACACDSSNQSAPDPKAAPSGEKAAPAKEAAPGEKAAAAQKAAPPSAKAEGKSAEPAAQPPAGPGAVAVPTPTVAVPSTVNDPVPADAHVCERFGRARLGHAWTFQKKPVVQGEPTSFEDAGYTVTSYELANHKLRMHHKRTTYMVTHTSVIDLTEDFRCDDEGMWFVTVDGNGTMTATADGKSWPTGQSTTYDPPMLVLPPVLEVGARWQSKSTQRHTATSEGSPPSVTTTEIDRSCEVKAKESVSVPAGTYEALRVDCTDARGGATATIWYADGVGAVKFGEYGPRLVLHERTG